MAVVRVTASPAPGLFGRPRYTFAEIVATIEPLCTDQIRNEHYERLVNVLIDQHLQQGQRRGGSCSGFGAGDYLHPNDSGVAFASYG